MVFATLVSTLIYSNFNVLSLAFGMSITAVSIDYLLHYHFHNFYQDKKIVDKNVLYGFLTTTAAFGIFSFIPIPIISQISFFAVAITIICLLALHIYISKTSVSQSINRDVMINKAVLERLSAPIFFILSILLA